MLTLFSISLKISFFGLLHFLALVIRTDLVLYKQHLLGLASVAPILHAFDLQRIDEPAVSLHAEFDLLDDMFGRYVAGSKGQDDLSLRVIGKGQDFLGLPGDLVILERIGGRDALAVHDHELPIEVDTNIHIIQPMLPLLVDLVLEGKLYVAAADLAGVDK